MQALTVTIYGLGIVFLALLVLMFSIMVLGKVFSLATGKGFLEAPNNAVREAPSPAAASAAPAAPVAAAPAPASAAQPAPTVVLMGFGGKQYRAELKDVTESAVTVTIDGTSYRIERNKADAKTVTVNGKAHTLEVKEVTDKTASVVIDGVAQTIQISREAQVAPAPAPAAATKVVKRKKVVSGGVEQVTAPLPGKILSVAVQVGDTVNAGDEVCVIEAMKMGNSIKAQRGGTVKEVLVSAGQTVGFGDALVVLAVGAVEEAEVEEVVPVQAAPAPASAPAPTPAPAAAPAPSPAAAAPASSSGAERITAPLPGKVLSVAVQVGQSVNKGDELCVIEAMKMGNSIKAQRAGTIREVLVSPGQTVGFGAPLFVME
ncbi:MAG: biotin/lipoyl-containing protein [Sphingomonadaceae bacterium]